MAKPSAIPTLELPTTARPVLSRESSQRHNRGHSRERSQGHSRDHSHERNRDHDHSREQSRDRGPTTPSIHEQTFDMRRKLSEVKEDVDEANENASPQFHGRRQRTSSSEHSPRPRSSSQAPPRPAVSGSDEDIFTARGRALLRNPLFRNTLRWAIHDMHAFLDDSQVRLPGLLPTPRTEYESYIFDPQFYNGSSHMLSRLGHALVPDHASRSRLTLASHPFSNASRLGHAFAPDHASRSRLTVASHLSHLSHPLSNASRLGQPLRPITEQSPDDTSAGIPPPNENIPGDEMDNSYEKYEDDVIQQVISEVGSPWTEEAKESKFWTQCKDLWLYKQYVRLYMRFSDTWPCRKAFCVYETLDMNLRFNPYRLHPLMYISIAFCFLYCIAVKWLLCSVQFYWIYEESSDRDPFVWKEWVRLLDTTVSIMPMVIQFVMFLFPPLMSSVGFGVFT